MAMSKGDMLTVPSSCHRAGQSQRAGTAADDCTNAFPGLQLCLTHLQSITVSFPLLCDWLNLFHLWRKKLLIFLLYFYNNIESYELSRVLLVVVIHIWYSVVIYFKFNSIELREWNLWDFICSYFLISILWVRVEHFGECFLCTRNACLFCNSQMPCCTNTSYIQLTDDVNKPERVLHNWHFNTENYQMYPSMCEENACACLNAMEVRGQLQEPVCFHRVGPETKLKCQIWWQVPFPAKPSHWLCVRQHETIWCYSI